MFPQSHVLEVQPMGRGKSLGGVTRLCFLVTMQGAAFLQHSIVSCSFCLRASLPWTDPTETGAKINLSSFKS